MVLNTSFNVKGQPIGRDALPLGCLSVSRARRSVCGDGGGPLRERPDLPRPFRSVCRTIAATSGIGPSRSRFLRGDCLESANAALNRTSITQPALFSIEYSLAQWWLAVGVRPHAMVGHSIGEYVAACLAGVLTLEDALALVAVRGRLMEQCPAGAMLAVGLSAEELSLTDACSLAAVNGPQQCVVSGPTAATTRASRVTACRRLTRFTRR